MLTSKKGFILFVIQHFFVIGALHSFIPSKTPIDFLVDSENFCDEPTRATSFRDAYVSGWLTVLGQTSLGRLTASNDVIFGSSLTVQGPSTFVDAVAASNRLDVGGQLAVAGATTLSSLTTTGSVMVGTDLIICGSLSVLGSMVTMNSFTNTESSLIIKDDFTVNDSTSLSGDVLIGRIDRTYGSLTVASSALFNNALKVTGSSVLNSLCITGPFTQDHSRIVKICGHKVIGHEITSLTFATKAFSLNFTSSIATAKVLVTLFGSDGSGSIQYSGQYFVTPVFGRSSIMMANETTNKTGPLSSQYINVMFAPQGNLVDVCFYTNSSALSVNNSFIFYEILGIDIESIT